MLSCSVQLPLRDINFIWNRIKIVHWVLPWIQHWLNLKSFEAKHFGLRVGLGGVMWLLNTKCVPLLMLLSWRYKQDRKAFNWTTILKLWVIFWSDFWKEILGIFQVKHSVMIFRRGSFQEHSFVFEHIYRKFNFIKTTECI